MCALMLDTDGGAKGVPFLGDAEGLSAIRDRCRGRAAWQVQGSDGPVGRAYDGPRNLPDAEDNECPPMAVGGLSGGATPLSSTTASSSPEQGLQPSGGRKRKAELLSSNLDDQYHSSGFDAEEFCHRLGDEAAHRGEVSLLNRWTAERQALKATIERLHILAAVRRT